MVELIEGNKELSIEITSWSEGFCERWEDSVWRYVRQIAINYNSGI